MNFLLFYLLTEYNRLHIPSERDAGQHPLVDLHYARGLAINEQTVVAETGHHRQLAHPPERPFLEYPAFLSSAQLDTEFKNFRLCLVALRCLGIGFAGLYLWPIYAGSDGHTKALRSLGHGVSSIDIMPDRFLFKFD